MTNIINEGSITIYDSQTGQRQTYNLGGCKLSLRGEVESIKDRMAYYAIIRDNLVFIQRCIKDYKPDADCQIRTSQIDWGSDWEHSVHIPIKSEKEQVVDTLMDTIKEIVASNSYFVLSKPEEQMRKELMNMVEED